MLFRSGLRHDDLGAAVLLFLDGGAAAQGDLAAAGGVGSKNGRASCRERV